MNKHLFGSSHILCWIYILRNTANDKVYVGQTWMPLASRWGSGEGYKNCTYLHNAIQKHGEGAFYYEILTVAHTQEMANHWEDYFVAQYDARNHDKGYNLKEAGSNGKHSQETKDKISTAHSGRVHSLEHRQNQSEALKGRRPSDETIAASIIANTGNIYRLGKSVSQETRDKLSKAFTGRAMPQETKDKISAANTGKIMPRDAVERSAAARRGLKRSPESIARITEGIRNRPPKTPEAIAKMTATMQMKEAERLQTPEVRAQHKIIEDMYIAGALYKDIMNAVDCREDLVTIVVKRAGIPLRGIANPPLGSDADAKIASMYRDDKLTANEIAKVIDQTPYIVRKSLRAQGIMLRKSGPVPKSDKL